jgi:hypothetical protein
MSRKHCICLCVLTNIILLWEYNDLKLTSPISGGNFEVSLISCQKLHMQICWRHGRYLACSNVKSSLYTPINTNSLDFNLSPFPYLAVFRIWSISGHGMHGGIMLSCVCAHKHQNISHIRQFLDFFFCQPCFQSWMWVHSSIRNAMKQHSESVNVTTWW